MTSYEVMYIVNAGLEDQPRAELIERFASLITREGGTIDKQDEWGKRRLAYPINDMNEGYYVLLRIKAPVELPRELERNLQISEDVIRYLVTKVEE